MFWYFSQVLINKSNISKVPNQNGTSQACNIVEIYHSGPDSSIFIDVTGRIRPSVRPSVCLARQTLSRWTLCTTFSAKCFFIPAMLSGAVHFCHFRSFAETLTFLAVPVRALGLTVCETFFHSLNEIFHSLKWQGYERE